MEKKQYRPVSWPLLVAAGAAAGFLNGFLGAGGGIILVFLLPVLLPGRRQKDLFALSLACIFAFCLVSAGFDAVQGKEGVRQALPLALPALIGGFLGAHLLDRISPRYLQLIFAAILAYGGFRMAF